jgi:signal transduction histidine kinase
VQKAVFFDIGLTLEAYFARMTANLRRALDLVYQANAELRQFAQLTSHDLKTPLATMVNLCDEALDEFGREIPGEAGKLIQAARNRALRMSATIDDLLQSAISMHEEQTQEALSPEPVLLETVELLRPLMEQKNIAIALPESMPLVRADRVRLREVFFNLLSNAIKYNDKSSGQIIVRAVTDERHCTISIIDNGPGIPPHELTRIFVPFRRLDAHRDTPGSGLGLYFAKTLVEQQGGKIWAESKPGQGSAFHIRLSLAEPPEE